MRKIFPVISLAIAALGLGCAQQVDVDKVPTGSEVQVTRQDGGLVEGKLADRDARDVTIDTGRSTRRVDRKEIADLRIIDAGQPLPSAPPSAKFREVEIPRGTALAVRIEATVASNANRAEDPVDAVLAESVVVADRDVLPAGAIIKGTVYDAEASGKVKGRARLSLRFTTVVMPGTGDQYPIAAVYAREAPGTKEDDAKKIGAGAIGGAIVGGLIGGGKGAAAGAAVGGGAGTAVVLATSGDEVRIERGTVLTVTLQKPVLVRVAIPRR